MFSASGPETGPGPAIWLTPG